ncbi:MAG: bifunctional helix-turn-helix transcriptional regulator/GNAT family N-acetyltransferase [Fidelibacterota bacterium]|nr:MAG: bifunctional helix-turn-helix transcriptional regulator/GNAT family N-acetyltransferase [Candidatus Neomarinimicrobiota bacterium]
MLTSETSQRIAAIRQFNRFYTQKIEVLSEGLLDTPYSLSEARVLFELGQRQDLTVTKLADLLSVDAGYMSRLVSAFEKNGLVTRTRSELDGRQWNLTLSSKGQDVCADLNSRANLQVDAMLDSLTDEAQIRLLGAMSAIEDILTTRSAENGPIVIRTHRPGDIGWIVQRHGVLYNEEYQFEETFEALVADILAKLIKTYDHKKDHIWIAEIDGERVGSIVASRGSQNTVQLRLFLVEPWAREKGIGKLLMKEYIQFARQAGYKRITLWTQSILDAARHLYELSGFELVAEESHHSFGRDLVAETWELEL